MKDFLPEVVQFSIPFIFVLLIIALAAGLSFLVYRQTNPDNSSYIRFFLGSLRTMLLIILLILLFKPKMIIQFFDIEQKNVALLVDYSASMNWEDESEKRLDSVKTAVSRIESISAEHDVKLHKTYFNQTILDKTDSLNVPFGTTNFKKVIDHLITSDFDMAILVSDGIRTEGQLPQVSRIPLYTVGIGKRSSFPDILITNVDYNPVVYQNKEQSIVVRISSNNLPESSAGLFVYLGNKLLAKKNIQIKQSGLEQEVTLKFKVNKTGLQRFMVEIKPDAEDSNLQNNTFVYTQDIIKNKIRLGIFSSLPNNDHKFLKFLALGSENIETFTYLKIKNKATEKYPIDSLDVLILEGYPARFTSSMDLNKIQNAIEKNRPGLIFFLNDYSDIAKVKMLGMDQIADNLVRRSKPLSFTISPVKQGSLLLRLYDAPEITSSFFNAIPPIISSYEIRKKKSSVQTLISGEAGLTTVSIMSVFEGQNQKIITMNGSGFWRWHFSLQMDDKLNEGYSNLLINMIRWAANKNKFQPVVLRVNKKTVHPGEEILFDGRLFDSQNNPITEGQIIINARSGDQKFTLPMETDSSGGFNARYTPINEGTYVFEAQGIADDKIVGIDNQNVVVVPYNREYIRTNQDSSFLRLLSESSGARYYNIAALDSLRNHLNTDTKEILVKEEIELRFKSWFLYFTIFVAVLEWAFRKKNNLP